MRVVLTLAAGGLPGRARAHVGIGAVAAFAFCGRIAIFAW